MRGSTFYRMQRLLLVALAIFIWNSQFTYGQFINVETPLHGVSDSYFERMGTNFGFSFPGGRGPGSRVVGLDPLGNMTNNLTFGQGSFGGTAPIFGGYDPSASGRFGFRNIGRNGGGFSLGLEFGKGSNRSVTSVAPNITVPNGFGGSIGSGSFRPFVTGVIPVVSDGAGFSPKYTLAPQEPYNAVTIAKQSGKLNLNAPPKERVARSTGPISYSNENSSAQQSDISVAAIKARRAAEERARHTEIEQLVSKAGQCEQKGDYSGARSAIRAALKLTDDENVKSQLRDRMTFLRGK